MRGILQFVLNSLGGHHIEKTEPLQDLPVRPRVVLEEIRKAHGSAFAAALAGAINSAEYLSLERLDDD